jgi:hypothetical protein
MKTSVVLSWLVRLSGILLICMPFLVPVAIPGLVEEEFLFVLNRSGTSFFIIYFFLAVYLLYGIETKWRFTERYQKRIGRLFFMSFIPIAVFLLLFIIRGLVYKTITGTYIDVAIIINGICCPLLIYSVLHNKLWMEKINVSRELIYSSITIFFIGSVLVALGITTYIFRGFGLRFTHFELVFWIFTFLFITVLAISSEQMRKRISKYINRRFYAHKHDYRQQFYRLHQTYKAYDAVHMPVMDLVDNLKYSLLIDKVYIYFLDSKDGNYHLYREHGLAYSDENVIAGDSPLVAKLKSDFVYTDFINVNGTGHERAILEKETSLIRTLGITSFFPIEHQNTLMGILATKQNKKIPLNPEDMEIIKVYATSIGNVWFTNRIVKERIAHTQFESFTHIASFVIHDIKNQVSTLSLLARNAQTNINKPDFQKSLVLSLQNCAAHLESLVSKFTSLPKEDSLNRQPVDINGVIREVLDTLQINLITGISTETSLCATGSVNADKNSFLYILMNIVKNAIEAMQRKGTLSITTGDIVSLPGSLKERFRFSEAFLASRRKYICVQDTGKGMSREFIEEKLFQPFTTTKDKGIGIGLYQSRMLLEKMGGTIVCDSTVGKGTVFCITI